MWYAGCSAADKKALLKAINTAVNDSSQPGHNLFELQPSGRHSLKTWVSQILFLLPQLIYIYILFIYYTYPPCQKSSPADWKSADPGALCSNYLFILSFYWGVGRIDKRLFTYHLFCSSSLTGPRWGLRHWPDVCSSSPSFSPWCPPDFAGRTSSGSVLSPWLGIGYYGEVQCAVQKLNAVAKRYIGAKQTRKLMCELAVNVCQRTFH